MIVHKKIKVIFNDCWELSPVVPAGIFFIFTIEDIMTKAFIFLLLISGVFASRRTYAQRWAWASASNNAWVDAWAITTDHSGNEYVGGVIINDGWIDTPTFGSIILPPTSTLSTAVWAKYNSSGSILWANRVTNGESWLYNIATDPSGNLIVFGEFSSATMQIGSFTLTNVYGTTNKAQYFLAKISPSGTVLWAINDGSVSLQSDLTILSADILSLGGIATDSTGNIYITSSFTEASMTIGSYTLTNMDPTGSTNDIFVAKYSPSGLVIWAKTIGGRDEDFGIGITVASTDNVYITGGFYSPSMTIGASVITDPFGGSSSTALPYAFIAEFSSAGVPLWAQSAGGRRGAYGICLASDSYGNVYMTGGFADTSISFGASTVTRTYPAAVPKLALYLVQYSPSDVVTWSKTIGSPTQPLFGFSITLAQCGQVWVSGNYKQNATIDDSTLTLVPGPDPIFIAGYYLSGGVAGYIGLGTGGDDQNGIASDVYGNIYICSDYESGAFDIGSDTFPAPYFAESFYICKYAVVPADTTYSHKDTTISCEADSLVLTAPAGYSVYYWNDSSNRQTRTITANGTYWVYNTTCGIPVLVDTFYVNFTGSLSAISGPSNVCVGLTITLPEPAPSGIWSSSNTAIATIGATGVVAGLVPGTSVLTYSSVSCGTATTIVTVNSTPNAGIITGPSVLCADTTISLTDTVTGGTWGSSSTDIATISGGVVTGISAGTTTISYSVPNTCGTAVALHIVTVNPLPNAGTITGSSTVCEGITTTLTDLATGGVWSSSGYASVSSSGVVISGISGVTATISYSVANSCGTAVATHIVSFINGPYSAGIAGPFKVCMGSSIMVTDLTSGGVWSSSDASIATVNITGVVAGLLPGTTIISYFVSNSCGAAGAERTETVNPLPVAGPITGLSLVCMGSSIILTGATSGGIWSNSNTVISTVSDGVVTGESPGTTIIGYSVTSASCGTASATKDITIFAPPSAGVITGLTKVCTVATILLTDPAPGGLWSSSSTSICTVAAGVVSGVSAGTATISYLVTNICGAAIALCIDTVNTTPNAGTITGPTAVCADSTITLTDLATGGVWSSGNTGVATVSGGASRGISAGTAIINYSVASAFCGTAAQHKTITVNPLPKAGAITGDSNLCFGTVISLADTITSGVWSSSNTGVCTIAAGVVTGVSVGTTIISYLVTSASCGNATAIKEVTVNPLPFAGTITGDSEACIGTPITLTDTATGGGAWSSSNTGIATVLRGIVTGITAGTDTIRYIASSASCGTAIAIKTVTINPLAFAGVITGDANTCIGTAFTLSDTITGGVWKSSNTSIGTVSDGNIASLATGTDTIEYIVTNTCGPDTAWRLITINPLPGAGTITGDSIVCKRTNFTLSETDTGGTWSSSNIAVATVDSSTGVVYGLVLGTTLITYTTAPNAYGCINETTFPITIGAGFTLSAAVSQVTCYGMNNGSIAITVTGSAGPFQYMWSSGNSTSAAADSLAPGIYTVNVKDSQTQCAAADSFPITQPDSLAIGADVKSDTCKSGKGGISIAANGGTAPYQYLWSNHATGSDVTELIAGTYMLTVTDMNNCKIESAIIVGDTCTGIIIHDVITPNGDGINDVWVIEGLQDYPKNTVQLFDKWGNLLYEQKNYNNDWGGRGSNGEQVPDGTYFYLVKLNTENIYGGKNAFTGALLVKR